MEDAMHAGLPWEGGPPKYILRTDVMYEAQQPPAAEWVAKLSSPYSTAGYEYPLGKATEIAIASGIDEQREECIRAATALLCRGTAIEPTLQALSVMRNPGSTAR
jgi:hypothetical protein